MYNFKIYTSNTLTISLLLCKYCDFHIYLFIYLFISNVTYLAWNGDGFVFKLSSGAFWWMRMIAWLVMIPNIIVSGISIFKSFMKFDVFQALFIEVYKLFNLLGLVS